MAFKCIVGKGENAGNQHFLLFPQCFLPVPKQISIFESHLFCHLQMLSIWASLKIVCLVKSQLFTVQQILRLVQIQRICRQQNNCKLKTEILFGMGRKHCGKRRKCWLPAFSPFPTMFSKGFFLGVVKSRDCVVKSEATFFTWQVSNMFHCICYCFASIYSRLCPL